MDKSSPTILFGAFDRHNFGDLLFPHIVGAMLPDRMFIHAGLAERDMRPYGGHRVRALVSLAGEMKDELVNIIHVGGGRDAAGSGAGTGDHCAAGRSSG